MATRVRRYDISLSCIKCGGIFYASRPDAKFCSSRCRKASEREIKELAEKFQSLTATLDGLCHKYKNTRRYELVEQLIALKTQLDGKITRFDY